VKIGRRITDIKFVIYKPRKSKEGKSGVGAVEDWLNIDGEIMHRINKSNKSGVAAVEDWLKGQNGEGEAIEAEVVYSSLALR
jgi:hypothetical protein